MDADLRNLFLESMSRVASAVTVVTTDGEAGRFGVTVSSMTSVSADTKRPSLLVSIHHLSPAGEAIRKNRRFCVNVLSGAQSHVSDLFSGRLKHITGDRFDEIAWRPGATGSPMIEGSIVSLDCELETAVLWGTHFILIGEARQIELSRQRSPLVYANRGYRRAVPISPDDHRPDSLRIGFFITLASELAPALIADFERHDIQLLEADHDDLVEQMRAGRLEAAITVGTVDEPELESELICSPAPHVLLAAGHPLATRTSLKLADLADQPMILLDYPSVRSSLAAFFARNGRKPNVRLQSPSFEMVRGLVAQGLGYSIVPQAPRNADSQVRAVPLAEDFPEGAVVAIVRQRSPQTEDFIAKCRASFGAKT
jgi:flavin reductase (DIM6/NTAB) family NADH-FMN oxidoreductase RutF/DNA-binding transcriptional LysR family regulator